MAIKSADQITIVDVTDAYSVILTSEAYTFVGGVDGVASGNTCTTQAVAFCGSSQCNSVSVTAANITCPTGISASVKNSGTSTVTITFTTTDTISTACEATIPVTVDGITVNKKFSFAVAKTGATGATGAQGPTGNGVSSSAVTYQVGTSPTSAPTGEWSSSVQATTTGQYLWTRTIITYTDGTTSTSYSVAAHGTTGVTGGTGPAGNGIQSTEVTYQVGTNGTTAPTGTWYSTVQATTKAGEYLWVRTVITFTDGNTSTAYTVSAHGSDGADGITMSITSSAGTVFKNSSGSTILTAHVFVGGVEQTITEAGVCGSYGSVKWYKGTSTTSVATARTYTVSASDVTNSLAITAQLE